MKKREKVSFLYRVAQIIAYPLFLLLYGLRLRGRENIPKTGSYIVCANHLSLLDPIFIICGFRRQIHFLTKIEVFKKPIIRALAKGVGAIPIDRGITDMSAIRASISVLEKGRCLGIFPQGTRHKGELPGSTRIKSGIGLLAYRAHADILPVNIETKDYKVKPFRRVAVTYGKPIPFDELGYSTGEMSEYYSAAAMIFGRICSAGEKEEKGDE